MPRNRIIYQSEALFVGPSPATGYHFSSGTSGENLLNQILRVQTANYNFNITRTDINQFGEIAAIGREIIEAPTVSLDFSYYQTNFLNEHYLGFTVAHTGNSQLNIPANPVYVSAISGLLTKVTDEKNYFIKTVAEGEDANTNGVKTLDGGVIGIGNAFLTSYSTEAAVGGLPTTTINVEALNMKFDTSGTNIDSPAVNPINGLPISSSPLTIPQGISSVSGQVSALRPGDITISAFNPLGASFNDLKIQSYTLSFDLAREPLQKLGSTFAFSREIQFPVTVTLSFEANMGDIEKDNLADILCNDTEQDFTITMKRPDCSGQGAVAIQYQLKGAKLDSENFSSSIGPSKTVSFSYSAQIGGPSQLTKGLFMSGSLA